MAKKPRVGFPEAFYHVITRGNCQQDIFQDAFDRKHYMDRLRKYQEKYQCILYAYVLINSPSINGNRPSFFLKDYTNLSKQLYSIS